MNLHSAAPTMHWMGAADRPVVNGISIQKIAEIFDEDAAGLQNFVEYADAFVSGEKSLSLDVTNKGKAAFDAVAGALAK